MDSLKNKKYKIDLQECACPVCSAKKHHRKYFFDDTGIGIVQCQECQLVFTSPRVAIDKLGTTVYHDEYFNTVNSSENSGNYVARDNILRQKWKNNLLPLIEKKTGSKGRLLDIGCATGILVDQADKMGWDAYGIEYSQYAAEYARKHFGINVQAGSLEDCDFQENFFDVVTMLNVLEHLPDPLTSLQKIYQILHTGGLLVIEVPDIDCPESKRSKQDWPLLQPDAHLLHFSKKTLTNLVKDAGFIPESIGGEGGPGVLNRLDNAGYKNISAFLNKNARYLSWLRTLGKYICHALSGTRTLFLVARKP